MIEELLNTEVQQAWIPAVVMGVQAALGAYSGWKKRKSQQKAADQDRDAMIKFQQQQNPMEAYAKLGQGKMAAALARAWGLDKVLGDKYLQHISSASSYPGTTGVGGAALPGMPATKTPGFGMGDLAGFGASIAGGIAQSMGRGSAASFGGGGGTPFQSLHSGMLNVQEQKNL